MSTSDTPHRHRIRLQGPWEWAVPTPVPSQAWTWNRIRLPEEWDRLPIMTGEAWFRRRFQTPTGLTPTDRLWIVLASQQLPSTVNLNGVRLKTGGEADSNALFYFEVTPHLQRRNLLEIAFQNGIAPTNLDEGLGRPVILEIETSSSGIANSPPAT